MEQKSQTTLEEFQTLDKLKRTLVYFLWRKKKERNELHELDKSDLFATNTPGDKTCQERVSCYLLLSHSV